MATDNAVVNNSQIDNRIYTWGPMANGDVGNAQAYTGTGDRTIQVTGTFGAGGSLQPEGSLDGVNWFQLKDPSNTAIAFTAAGLKAILEHAPFIRPHVTAGDGTTSLTCIISVRSTFYG